MEQNVEEAKKLRGKKTLYQKSSSHAHNITAKMRLTGQIPAEYCKHIYR